MNEYEKDRPTSEQLVDLLDNELEITICADVVHGLDYEYKQLQEENKKLNGAIQTYDILLKSNVEENKILKENAENNDKVVDKVNWENMLLKKENKRLKDNWNKLKEWLETNWKESQDIWFVKIINKMQELEQGSDNK